jgi:hypothetical protein
VAGGGAEGGGSAGFVSVGAAGGGISADGTADGGSGADGGTGTWNEDGVLRLGIVSFGRGVSTSGVSDAGVGGVDAAAGVAGAGDGAGALREGMVSLGRGTSGAGIAGAGAGVSRLLQAVFPRGGPGWRVLCARARLACAEHPPAAVPGWVAAGRPAGAGWAAAPRLAGAPGWGVANREMAIFSAAVEWFWRGAVRRVFRWRLRRVRSRLGRRPIWLRPPRESDWRPPGRAGPGASSYPKF